MTPQRFNILLIDDSAEAAQLFELALREGAPQAKLYWVASPEEGIEALGRTGRFVDILGIDIVVLDLNLGSSDGFDVLQRMRTDDRFAAKPVVVMSSSRVNSDVQRAYRCGANSYVVKPLSLERTFEVVAALAKYWLDIVTLPE